MANPQQDQNQNPQQDPNQNTQQDENQNPPQQEQEISQPEPIGRPPPRTQDNIINEIERGKNELEALIGRLKACGQTNSMRAQLASSLESIKTHIAFVSGQLDVWRVKRDEQKRYYVN